MQEHNDTTSGGGADNELNAREAAYELYHIATSSNPYDGRTVEGKEFQLEVWKHYKSIEKALAATEAHTRQQVLKAKLKEHEMMQHQAITNLKSAKAVAEWSELRVATLRQEYEEGNRNVSKLRR